MKADLYKLIILSDSADKIMSKDATLEDIKDGIKEEKLSIDYDEYIWPEVLWATESKEKIASTLSINKVVPEGGYIAGLFGGEKKRGKARYAGLVLEQYYTDNNMHYIHFSGLSKAYKVPNQLMKQYTIDIYRIYYRGLINPFVCKTYRVILSKQGEFPLKNFLKAFIKFNEQEMTVLDQEKIEGLIRELRFSLDLFNKDSFYTIYRRNRAFTACVPKDLENAVSSHMIGYIECKSAEQSYYYAAALNYLAYKVVEKGRAFIRDQFAKPLIALITAGLSWRDVPEDLRNEVSNLSRNFSGKLQWQPYPNQAKALKEVAQTEEFKRIITLLDQHIEKAGGSRLEEALTLVSASGEESNETTQD